MFLGCSSKSTRKGGPTRRQMLVRFGQAAFGLTLPALLQQQAAAAGAGRAKSVILLFLSGGASQYETFDPKPDAPSEFRGDFKPLRTNVPGIEVTDELPLLARCADKYALIRSMTHTEPNHPAGVYWMITGRKYPRAGSRAVAMSREDHPHFGSVLAKVKPPEARDVPGFVTLPEQMNPNGPIRAGQHAGFMGAAYDPFVINDDPNLPNFTPGELRVSQGLTEGRLLRRRALLQRANLLSAIEEEAAAVPVPPHYAQAFDLITGSKTAEAFDIERESPKTRERYGRHIFGQSTLLARRLVEAGTRLVAVNWVRHDDGAGWQGWDTHQKHISWSREELMPPTDRAVSALLTDLHERGLLDGTLVILTGEFGRTPRFNKDGGRDHWPNVFSLLVAGGGIRGGQVYGASTLDGAYVASDPVSPGDLAATMYHCLGIPPQTEIQNQEGRPFPVAEGEVVHRLLR